MTTLLHSPEKALEFIWHVIDMFIISVPMVLLASVAFHLLRFFLSVFSQPLEVNILCKIPEHIHY